MLLALGQASLISFALSSVSFCLPSSLAERLCFNYWGEANVYLWGVCACTRTHARVAHAHVCMHPAFPEPGFFGGRREQGDRLELSTSFPEPLDFEANA